MRVKVSQKMPKPTLSVLLPASLTAEEPDLQRKTLKVGLVGRALAIFRVDRVIIFLDDDPKVQDQEAEASLVEKLLRYMETPQYLRKLLLPHMKELRYAGLLPPLRTPHHPRRDERARPGDYREAVVVEVNRDGSLLELGLREKGFTRHRLKVGQRLTVRLGERLESGRIAVEPVRGEEIGEYWGYEVFTAEGLAEALRSLRADYAMGTSKYGKNIYEAVRGIKDNKPASVAIAFGGPHQGLFEICRRQGVDAEELFDVVVNTIPQQGTETVRTEEALVATLALLNALVWVE